MEPQPVILLEVLVSGVLMLVTMMIHGCGMYAVVQSANRLAATQQRMHRSLHVGQVVTVVVLLALVVLMVDISVWALAFSAMGLISDTRLALHFAALTYTTLGASTSLPSHWLLLEASCAIAGTFTFAWTTAVMFQIFNRLFAWDRV